MSVLSLPRMIFQYAFLLTTLCSARIIRSSAESSPDSNSDVAPATAPTNNNSPTSNDNDKKNPKNAQFAPVLCSDRLFPVGFVGRNPDSSNTDPNTPLKTFPDAASKADAASAVQTQKDGKAQANTEDTNHGIDPTAAHKDSKPVVVNAPHGLPLTVHVYSNGDIVSNEIMQNGVWEGDELRTVFQALDGGVNGAGSSFLEEDVKLLLERTDVEKAAGEKTATATGEETKSQAQEQTISSAESSQRTSLGQRTGLLLDIGANIGWYSLNAAAAGHDVIAFEPFKQNVELIQKSMCDATNREKLGGVLEKKIKLYPLALDQKVQNCDNYEIPKINFGDSISICDDIEPAKKQQWLDQGYQKLSESKTATLDSALEAGLFPRKVDIMKMDVEGYEPRVLAGASKFLKSEYAPDKIIMESVPALLGMAGGTGEGSGEEKMQKEFTTLLDHGYVAGNMDTPEKIVAGFKQFGELASGNPQFDHKQNTASPGKSLLEIQIGALGDVVGDFVESKGDLGDVLDGKQGGNKRSLKKVRFVFERKKGGEGSSLVEEGKRQLRRNDVLGEKNYRGGNRGGEAIEK